MHITTAIVGTRSLPLEVAITPRFIMNYAAGVPDPNPAYFDDCRTGGIVAHPVSPAALTWPLLQDFIRYWPDTDLPTAVRARQVHQAEAIAWTRPLRPGDTIHIEGVVEALRQHRAGAQVAITFHAADGDARPVFQETVVGLFRDVACEGDPAEPFAQPPEGPPAWEQRITLDPLAAHHYDAGSGIHFPLHTSPAFARSVGLSAPIYQGTALLALVLREVVNREAGGDPRRIRSLFGVFRKPVLPGDAITVRGFSPKPIRPDGRSVSFQIHDLQGVSAHGGYAILSA